MKYPKFSTAPMDGTPFLAWNGFWHVLWWVRGARAESGYGTGEFLTPKMETLHPPPTEWTTLPVREAA